MKRAYSVCFLFILLVISLQFVSAISTNIKDSYSPGETVITQIAGNILEPISSNSVEFRRGHVLVPFDYELKKLGDGYYLWFNIPENDMNYTLLIKDITTFVSGKIQKVNYTKNFSVSGNLTDYSIKPGFVYTDKNFTIKLQFNEDSPVDINLNFLESSSFTIKPGENDIKFSISGVNESGLFNVTIGKYEIPVYVFVNKTSGNGGFLNLTNESEIIELTNFSGGGSINITKGEASLLRCYEFPGKICAANEVCVGGNVEVSSDGQCCAHGGDCAIASSSSGIGYSWIGYLLAGIVILVIVIIYVRYRKVKNTVNPITKKFDLNDKRAMP